MQWASLSKNHVQHAQADKMDKIQKRIQQITDNIKGNAPVRIGQRQEMQYTKEILEGATIVCTTLSSAINLLP